MQSKPTNSLVLLGALSMLFALALGGAPPAGDEGGGVDGAEAVSTPAVSTPAVAGTPVSTALHAEETSTEGVGPIPLDVQLFTVMPSVYEGVTFSIDIPGLISDLKAELSPKESKKAPDAQEAPAQPVVTHVVKSGETLWDIAKIHGVDVDTILSANKLNNENRLKIGQELRVPTVKGVLHTVRQGENLWDIAKSYKVDAAKIISANNLTSPERLQPKQELMIPGAKLAKAPQTSAQQRRALVVNGRLQRAFAWPVQGRISSRFGPRWGRMHEGVDIAVNTGTPVRAAGPGKVTFAGWGGNYGYLVKVDHGNNVETRYAHCSRLLVRVGQSVTAGQVLARSGNTGRSTGPHLHFEIRYKGRAYNPLDYLR